ncbi:SPFH domain-containing protein [Idiomarina loihiensis]|jgi:regulator of protease activity HflC (stomatin/prohibitin superfamily)|uniref:Membrane protease, stomatin/prohibitin family n=1 Tax=Idiomarina loihiensis (strain ATCC BAA-735 / DSM 15497 / L2-TR) TaxID=283942 RepID=Q5QXF9_IDILO|nr:MULTISPECIES: SPFH domain-containing protein [Idiomarina]AAV80989.1 Membrane protease, stomatin/prohibitin family [Idiomarina loihiensis L2TR]AGM35013.1 membrane protease stomatin/prohibitin-like protein [Idiomarina loihiensis GSL 199]MBL4856351.1 SPFH domain-containing protein [Idiomarina sp.]MRJ44444.1 SPFH domain-containing protein [Idiomarina loihiensis]UTW32523.1 SPFH domain-containing protein [Idiomarina loihiensis]|tara:strand:+ start:28726 stop:29640 length:915 start_codon:yes stop_codon:yes gene_type:complete
MNNDFNIMWVVAAVVVLLLLIASVRIVPQQSVYLVELFGRYRRMLTPGLNFIIPLIEQVAHKQSMRTRQLDVDVETKTNDNVFVIVRVSVQYRVSNETAVYNAFYQLENPEWQMQSYVFDTVRAQIPKQNLDAVFDNKDSISKDVKEQLRDTMEEYGFEIIASLVTDIDPDQSVKDSMNQINAAERERRAAEHKAEAEKIMLVKQAEADKESKILQGQGIAGQRLAIAEGLRDSIAMVTDQANDITSKDVIDLLKFTNYVDVLGSFDTAASKVIMLPQPTGQLDSLSSDILSAMEAAKDSKKDG